MARRGLNCTLSYPGEGRTRAYRVRADVVTFGYEMVADESQARTRKAFYPHQTAPTQFAIRVLLIGNAERRSLNGWLMTYVNHILDPGLKGRTTPQMTVSVPNRNFTRVGVPIAGFEFGDRTGSMVWTPMLTFETSGEPIDWDEKFRISRVSGDLARLNSPETEFFYPTGTQLRGGDAPASTGYQTVQQVVNGDVARQDKVSDQIGDVLV